MLAPKKYLSALENVLSPLGLKHRYNLIEEIGQTTSHEIVKKEQETEIFYWCFKRKFNPLVAKIVSEPIQAKESVSYISSLLTYEGLKIKVIDLAYKEQFNKISSQLEKELGENVEIVSLF